MKDRSTELSNPELDTEIKQNAYTETIIKELLTKGQQTEESIQKKVVEALKLTTIDQVGVKRMQTKGISNVLFDLKFRGVIEFDETNKTYTLIEQTPTQETESEFDELYEKARDLILDTNNTSITNLQRVFKIGYNRAARIMEQLEAQRIVGPPEGGRGIRQVLRPRSVNQEGPQTEPEATKKPADVPKPDERSATPDASKAELEKPDIEKAKDTLKHFVTLGLWGVSTNHLQQEMQISQSEAEAFLQQLESQGFVGPENALGVRRIQLNGTSRNEANQKPENASVSEATPDTEAAPAPEPIWITERVGLLRKLSEGFRHRADQFVRKHLKGEYLESEEKKPNVKEMTTTIATTGIGIAMSLGGIKSPIDIVRWLPQVIFIDKEKRRIFKSRDDFNLDEVAIKDKHGKLDTGWEVVKADGEMETVRKIIDGKVVEKTLNRNEVYDNGPSNQVDRETRRLEKALQASKYLTPEKKQELLTKLQKSLTEFHATTDSSYQQHTRRVGKIINEAIQTRVKGVTVLKETLNTVLIGTGLTIVRSAAYGAVALGERFIKVQKERKSGERTGGMMNELIVKGCSETWDKLRLKTGKTKKEKFINLAQALGTVGRFTGFSVLAGRELVSGDVSDTIDRMLTSWEEKEVGTFIDTNLESHADRLAALADTVTLGLLSDDEPVQVEAGGGGEVGEAVEVGEAGETVEVGEREVEEVPLVEGTIPEGETEPLEPEVTVAEIEPAMTESELEAGTVKRGDGVIRTLQRQLKLNPTKYGYDGDANDKRAIARWVKKTAFGITKDAGMVNSKGWLGLSGKGIGKMSIGLIHGKDDKPTIQFFDAKTGAHMDMEEAREKGYVYDDKKPRVVVEEVPAARSEPESTEQTGGEPTAAGGESAVEPKVVVAEQQKAVESISPSDQTDISSATTDQTFPPTKNTERSYIPPAPGELPTQLGTFTARPAQVTFTYEGNQVVGANLEYKASTQDIEKALARIGTTRGEIRDIMTARLPHTQGWKVPERAQALEKLVEREARAEAVMDAMATDHKLYTPEYQALRNEAGKLKTLVKTGLKGIGFTKDQLANVDHATRLVDAAPVTAQDIKNVGANAELFDEPYDVLKTATEAEKAKDNNG